MTKQVAILGFHKIGESPNGWDTWFYIREMTFVDHLNHLKEHGWNVINVRTFLEGLTAPEKMPERAALLTFDDGYRSMRDVVLPCLLRFGYPAVLFVPTDYIGKVNSFDAGNEPEEAICDWEDLWELSRCGVSVQSHGASHRAFSELCLTGKEEEIHRSKVVLEAGLGEPVEIFSFPYGDRGSDPTAVEKTLERAGYRAACLYGGGPAIFPIAAPYALTRLAMGPETDLRSELGERVLPIGIEE